MNKLTIKQKKPATANLVISNGVQPLLLSCYLNMLVQVDEASFILNFLASLLT